MPESIGEFFEQNFCAHLADRAYGKRCGYRMQWFTYAQVLQMASHVATELEQRGINKGDRVMLWGPNSAEWVAAFFGCALRGVIVVPMDHAASADFFARVARQVDAKLTICSRDHSSAGSQNEAAQIPEAFLEQLSKSADDSPRANLGQATIAANDTLQIVFTSGTTSEPKGVVISHGNVLANVAPLAREMLRYGKYERLVHPVRFLNLLPLSHVFGQFLSMFLPPLLGGTVIFQDELKPSEIANTIRRERVSVLVTVPRVLQSLKQKIERDLEGNHEVEDFRHRFLTSKDKHFLHRWWIFRDIRRQFGWKFWAFICGGAALDANTEEFWGRLGYAAIQGYGLTETTSLISVNHPFKLGKGSIGKVLPGREVKLAADGEILVRGAGVTSGYWGVADSMVSKEGAPTNAEWYHTGDVGALDQAGNLYFKGRKKEVIVTPAGLNIYPEDLEAALRRQPEVKDCVVVGIDRDGNAEPCAVVIMRANAGVKDAAMRIAMARANQSLAEFQRIRIFFEWPQEDFPRTSTQKPRRNLIKEFATKQLIGEGKNPASVSPVADLIARITGRTPPQLDHESQLDANVGLSSLDRVELIGALEDRYQLDLSTELSEARLDAVRTIGDVERLLRGETPPLTAYHFPDWTLRWPTTWLRLLAQYLLIRPAMRLLAWPTVEGRENLAAVDGPLLVISNHISDVDIGFIQTALPARLRNRLAIATRGEALEALHTPGPGRNFIAAIFDRMKWLLGVSLLNLFPLPREAGFRQSFAYAGRAVDRGYSVLVFPEGRHTVDGKMNPFRAGIGLLAGNLNIPVLPMRIRGLFELKQAGKRTAPPGKIHVRIGKPIMFPSDAAPEQIARALQTAVESL